MCSEGNRTRNVTCISSANNNATIPDRFCNNRTRPFNREICNYGFCPYRYFASAWSAVSQCTTVILLIINEVLKKENASDVNFVNFSVACQMWHKFQSLKSNLYSTIYFTLSLIFPSSVHPLVKEV